MPNRPQAFLHRLPLVTLYVTERCNSRCVTCDYWRHGRDTMTLKSVKKLLPDLRHLETETVLLSGGEPLLNPEWPSIAKSLRANGQKVWLLSSGLSLAKHAREAAELFDDITVSLDGIDRETYRRIRGLDAFDTVCAGIRSAAAHGRPPGIRVTLQRENYRQLPGFVKLARDLGAAGVSYLAVDIASPHAFGRSAAQGAELALGADDLPVFDQVLRLAEREHAADFDSGFIAESPQKLRRILEYFTAVLGAGAYPKVRCNAPQFSAVIGATGRVQPCFFITGPEDALVQGDLRSVLNSEPLARLRGDIQAGGRAECKTCVCSKWRDS